MTATLPAGRRTYHEVVSTHCASRSAPRVLGRNRTPLQLHVGARQAESRRPLSRTTSSPSRTGPNDLILVDEGTLVVAKVGGAEAARSRPPSAIKFSREFVPGAARADDVRVRLRGTSPGTCSLRGREQGRTSTEERTSPACRPTARGSWRARAGAPARRAGAGQTRTGGTASRTLRHVGRALRESATVLERGAGLPGRAAEPRRRGAERWSRASATSSRDTRRSRRRCSNDGARSPRRSASKVDAGDYTAASAVGGRDRRHDARRAKRAWLWTAWACEAFAGSPASKAGRSDRRTPAVHRAGGQAEAARRARDRTRARRAPGRRSHDPPRPARKRARRIHSPRRRERVPRRDVRRDGRDATTDAEHHVPVWITIP